MDIAVVPITVGDINPSDNHRNKTIKDIQLNHPDTNRMSDMVAMVGDSSSTIAVVEEVDAFRVDGLSKAVVSLALS